MVCAAPRSSHRNVQEVILPFLTPKQMSKKVRKVKNKLK